MLERRSLIYGAEKRWWGRGWWWVGERNEKRIEVD